MKNPHIRSEYESTISTGSRWHNYNFLNINRLCFVPNRYFDPASQLRFAEPLWNGYFLTRYKFSSLIKYILLMYVLVRLSS
jgi:hypothetical protein